LPPTARLNHQQVELIKAEFARMPEMNGVIGKLAKLPNGRFVVKHTDDWFSRTVMEQQVTRRIGFWLAI